jgi:hypothetical protein
MVKLAVALVTAAVVVGLLVGIGITYKALGQALRAEQAQVLQAVPQDEPRANACQTVEFVLENVPKHFPGSQFTVYDGARAAALTKAFRERFPDFPYGFEPSHIMVLSSPALTIGRGAVLIGLADNGCAEDEFVFMLPINIWTQVRELAFGRPA